MKTRLLSFIVIAAISMSSFNVLAQNANEPVKEKRVRERPTPEQMMERHIKMMEKKLVMDDATAAKFTPMYKEYLQAMKECRPAVPKDVKKTELTDAEIEKAIQDRFEAKKKAIDVQQKYFQKFKSILNAKQLEKVFQPMMGTPIKPMMKDNRMMKRGDKFERMSRPGCGNCPFEAK